jgi:glucose/arabinose dehydrogenase
MKRFSIALVSCALALAPATVFAEPGQGHGKHQDKDKGGGPGEKKPKHEHKNKNGKQALGAKIKQDGKHKVGKFKDKDVVAEVKGGKVRNMTAGDTPAKRVRTKNKMASAGDGLMLAAWKPGVQLAQYDEYYYGYCFDDGYTYDCYWYPAEDVYYEDYTWEEYDPYY